MREFLSEGQAGEVDGRAQLPRSAHVSLSIWILAFPALPSIALHISARRKALWTFRVIPDSVPGGGTAIESRVHVGGSGLMPGTTYDSGILVFVSLN